MSTREKTRYRKIEAKMFGDHKFSQLSPLQPSGQALWIYLLCGPFTGPIPGLYRAGRAAMAEALGWEQEAFDKAFSECERQEMVKADWKNRVIYIPNCIKHNAPQSLNVLESWILEWESIPECNLKTEAYENLRSYLENLSSSFEKHFIERIKKPIINNILDNKTCHAASLTTCHVTSHAASLPTRNDESFVQENAKASYIQEQEQEQEQDRTPISFRDVPSLQDIVSSQAENHDEPLLVVQEKTAKIKNKHKAPDCPHLAIIDLYHEILPMCPYVENWNETATDANHLRARWRSNKERQSLGWWREFFEYIAKSKFLTGMIPPKPPNEQSFIVDFRWIIGPKNFIKIMSGRYHRD